MSSIRTEVGLDLPDMGGDRRVRQEIDALSVQTVRLPRHATIIRAVRDTPFYISPKNGEEGITQRPAGHR